MIDNIPNSEVFGPLAIAAGCLLAIVAIRAFKKGPRLLRTGLYIVLFLATVEFSIFRNPHFIKQCWLHFTSDQIGWKQRDSLRLELFSRERSWKVPYLAVGSSQAWAVFGQASTDRKDIQVFHSAGLTPVEMNWYRDTICRHCGDTIILYLSELDLARAPSVESFKLSPRATNSEFARLSQLLLDHKVASYSDIADLYISNQISIYREQFLAKGILCKAAEKIGGPDATRDRAQAGNSGSDFNDQISEIATIDDTWFGTNLESLGEFFTWCDSHDCKVVVAQGEYYPSAMAILGKLRERARQSLTELCARHANARYLGTEEVPGFSGQQYADATHVKMNEGAKFVDRLIAHLRDE
jgi:hypothetical protein